MCQRGLPGFFYQCPKKNESEKKKKKKKAYPKCQYKYKTHINPIIDCKLMLCPWAASPFRFFDYMGCLYQQPPWTIRTDVALVQVSKGSIS
jgi:hypothetical protein